MTLLSSLTIVSVVNDRVVGREKFFSFVSVLQHLAEDFDFVLVSNNMSAQFSLTLKNLVTELPDTTVIFLAQPTHDDLARLAGIENAIGDYIIFCDLEADDPGLLPALLEPLKRGYDLVVCEIDGGVNFHRSAGRKLLLAVS